jgi:endoglucanase
LAGILHSNSTPLFISYTSLVLCAFLQTLTCSAQITRGDISEKKIALVFTGDEFADGAPFILETLRNKKVKASFFLTGNFYRNKNFKTYIDEMKKDGHYLGSHSDKHLLYCDWNKRDSLLVTKQQFDFDLQQSYRELRRWKITKRKARFFLPPFEWYNDSIVNWTHQHGLELVNFTAGTRSTADYTYPEMANRYVSSDSIYNSILRYETKDPNGLNGFILLVHIGTDPRRKDKFYKLLPHLIDRMLDKEYAWMRIDELLK